LVTIGLQLQRWKYFLTVNQWIHFCSDGGAIIPHILKVDGGDSMTVCSLDHVASQAPVLGVRAELQDLVIGVIVSILATWI